jgi:hypothetical protein
MQIQLASFGFDHNQFHAKLSAPHPLGNNPLGNNFIHRQPEQDACG